MAPKDDLSPIEAFKQHLSYFRYRSFVVVVGTICLLLAVWKINDLALPNTLADPLTYLQMTGGQSQKPVKEEHVPPIPSKIWQIMLAKDKGIQEAAIDPEDIRETTSWLAMNTDYT